MLNILWLVEESLCFLIVFVLHLGPTTWGRDKKQREQSSRNVKRERTCRGNNCDEIKRWCDEGGLL
jgi:uncharacterized membrane protein